eukprot:9426082-Pyramimonas_sp.AAC.1
MKGEPLAFKKDAALHAAPALVPASPTPTAKCAETEIIPMPFSLSAMAVHCSLSFRGGLLRLSSEAFLGTEPRATASSCSERGRGYRRRRFVCPSS